MSTNYCKSHNTKIHPTGTEWVKSLLVSAEGRRSSFQCQFYQEYIFKFNNKPDPNKPKEDLFLLLLNIPTKLRPTQADTRLNLLCA